MSLRADAIEHAARVRLGSIALRAAVRGASQLRSCAGCEEERASACAARPGLVRGMAILACFLKKAHASSMSIVPLLSASSS